MVIFVERHGDELMLPGSTEVMSESADPAAGVTYALRGRGIGAFFGGPAAESSMVTRRLELDAVEEGGKGEKEEDGEEE